MSTSVNAIGPDSLFTLTSRLEGLGGERHARLSSLKKPLILRHPELVLARTYEMVPIGTISSPSEGGRTRGKNHQAFAVKGTRHPTPSRTQAIAVRGERVNTAPPSLETNISIFMQFLLLKYNQIILPRPFRGPSCHLR